MHSLLKRLGPGLLFAGAAIGVSHIFQSTRAGAEFGFSLIAFVILSNLLKYPFFEAWQGLFVFSAAPPLREYLLVLPCRCPAHN